MYVQWQRGPAHLCPAKISYSCLCLPSSKFRHSFRSDYKTKLVNFLMQKSYRDGRKGGFYYNCVNPLALPSCLWPQGRVHATYDTPLYHPCTSWHWILWHIVQIKLNGLREAKVWSQQHFLQLLGIFRVIIIVIYRLVQKKRTVLLSSNLAWPAVAGCSWAETFSQLSSISFAQPCNACNDFKAWKFPWGASIYDVRTEGGAGVSPKEDVVGEVAWI